MLFKNTSVWTAVKGIGGSGGTAWYVRPAGGSYGAEDGTTYDTAWDGFSNIDWTATGVQPGDTLYVCGTHTELLSVGGSGIFGQVITIRGDYSEAAGIIDGEDTRNACLAIESKNYVTISAISLIDAVVSCSYTSGTSSNVIFNGVISLGSGNQAFQNLNTAEVSYFDCILSGCADDGYSLHDSAVVNINGGTITGCDQAINVIEDGVCTVSNVVFIGSGTYDIYVTQSTGLARVDASNCVFSKHLWYESSGQGSITDSRVAASVLVSATAVLNVERCLFDGTAINDHLIDVLGEVTIKYCVFTNMQVNKFATVARAGSTAIINNCTIFNGVNAGKGVFAAETFTINNVIVEGLNTGLLTNGAITLTANNTSFYDNSDDINDGSGTVVNNNPQAGNPGMVDPDNEDFSLGGASTIIGDGLDLGASYETGIDTADWGDSGTIPVVTTKTQTGSWDIGAHIS